MNNSELILEKLDAILASHGINPPKPKYLTAKQAEVEFGISAKTLLNRSKKPASHKQYVPYIRLSGGRKKYFERKVLERLFSHTNLEGTK